MMTTLKQNISVKATDQRNDYSNNTKERNHQVFAVLSSILKFFLPCILLLIFLSVIATIKCTAQPLAKPTVRDLVVDDINISNLSSFQINYKLVEESVLDGKNYKRFAAFMITKDTVKFGNETAIMISNDELSIINWATLISSHEKNHDLIDEFTQHINYHTTGLENEAYFFETKGTSMIDALRKQFEFVLVQAEELNEHCKRKGPQPDKFQEHLSCKPLSATCCTFDNLSQTARLISPKKLGDYCHIGTFLRTAPKNEIYQMWKTVTKEYLLTLQRNPPWKRFWLSTSGLKVSWLHFRIDEEPKSYSFSPFLEEA